VRLLVSAIDPVEARTAVAGGADIVDVKNPFEGPLGAPAPGTIAGVRAAVPASLPVSAAIGDPPPLPGTAALAALGAARSGAAYVKVGLGAVASEAGAVGLLRAIRDAVGGGPACVIAAAYADAERLGEGAFRPQLLPRVAAAAGIAGCLLDTAVKDGRGLFEWLTSEVVASLVAEAHALGLLFALAGSLREADLPRVLATGADIAGVRSAACAGGARTASLEAERIQRLRAVCASRPTPRGAGAAG
jgi:uncharacterized protein (UPF0264 family)